MPDFYIPRLSKYECGLEHAPWRLASAGVTQSSETPSSARMDSRRWVGQFSGDGVCQLLPCAYGHAELSDKSVPSEKGGSSATPVQVEKGFPHCTAVFTFCSSPSPSLVSPASALPCPPRPSRPKTKLRGTFSHTVQFWFPAAHQMTLLHPQEGAISQQNGPSQDFSC